MKMNRGLAFLGCAFALSGCMSFFGDSYSESVDEDFELLDDEYELRERIAEGGDLVIRYEFLTDAPFGGDGVLPARSDNRGRQIWGKDKNFAGSGSYVRKEGMWNFSEVFLVGGKLEVYLNGYLVTTADKVTPYTKWIGYQGKEKYRNIRVKELEADSSDESVESAPVGFEAYFSGRPEQLREMWKGVTTDGKFDNPLVRQAATKEESELMQIVADSARNEHWRVRNGALYFDGFKGGYSLATKKDYADFELWADWRLMSVTGDSGLYLRGCPQVQIWDAYNQWHIGSGGLYNNDTENTGNPSKALEIADNLIGDWNRFHVIMRGDKVTVWLNGELVVDEVTLENYWDRSQPVFPTGQIELQCHGDPIEWRNIYIRAL